MQSKNIKIKFKNIQPKYDSNNSPAPSNKVYFYTLNENDIEGFTNRLDSIENLLNKLINNEDKSKCIDDYYNNEKEKYNSRALISMSQSKILHYEDYPRHLITYYFTMQFYCSFPPILNIKEYFQCAEYFNTNVPEYLISAIMCRSSLTSPHSQLFAKNREFSDYYYCLSMKQLNESFINGNLEVYMLYTIFILLGVGQDLNRHSDKGALLVKCVKLVQILGIDDLENNPLFNQLNLSPQTIKKLLLYVRYYNNEACKIFNLPKLIKYKELHFDDFNVIEEEKYEELIDFQVNSLSKDYFLAFKSFRTFVNIIYPKSLQIEDNLFITRASTSFKECFEIINRVQQLYYQLPSYIKFSKDCLNREKVEQDPLLRVRLRIYQVILQETARIFKLMVRVIDKLSTEKIIYLAEKLMKFAELPIRLLKTQQASLLIPGNNTVSLNILTAFNIGNVLLELMIKLPDLNSEIQSPKLSILKSMVKTEFNRLVSHIRNLEPNWEGSKSVLESFVEKFELISD
ncbi:hypothetical protein CONCODRAFT_3467 [Conidiobolus coronatus NRRL 28638]|uniref:Transcription factor domain-containing protein n=1 Tax=Conidiobolus coronatus (strain ATCC 28846 / CBS 209.66 / NRRL 28638) TaxID=796925 RepID=A0A137PEZ0_CONC2|nr:hypothetical protein CONCODRAFT_3467 [Conidiobolus coronatus NRRL 28638]|eukprot:KXN73511.1 hypothetical protein CONCODRAFT_3467 [Conidiobolus coronatus NRRL 28638]